MWNMPEQVASRRERGMAERAGADLPPLSMSKWRRWASKSNPVHCSRAAGMAGAA